MSRRGAVPALTIILLLVGTAGLCALESRDVSKVIVAGGWHPWYEVKADPANSDNLILCGSAWDVQRNALQGFVYVTSNAGKTWSRALYDQSSSWVSEQSCAFGPRHTAFFLSEASKVVDEEGRHHQGTTRIFVSTDAGQHWKESATSAWADWSTSAVSRQTGNLFVFFNDASWFNAARREGNSVGLLVFSARTNHVSGPFVSARMNALNYRGVYPSDALCLRDGTMVALYLGYRDTPGGRNADLGLERILPAWPPAPAVGLIATSNLKSGRNCLGLGNYALAYDTDRDRLFAVYRDLVGQGCGLLLSISRDGGRSWEKRMPIILPSGGNLDALHPSLAVGTDGDLGLVWDEDKDWFFTRVNLSGLTAEPMTLHGASRAKLVVGDSLWSVFDHLGRREGDSKGEDATVELNVRTLPGRVWRVGGLAATQTGFQAVVPGVNAEDEKLYSFAIDSRVTGRITKPKLCSSPHSETDVTRQAVLLYGRSQSFDNATGNLSVEVRLGNRGDRAFLAPIRLEVVGLSSEAGRISILNADNGSSREGAAWSLSEIVVGDRIAPGATTYNTETLLFHIDLMRPGPQITNNLLTLNARVMAHLEEETEPSAECAN